MKKLLSVITLAAAAATTLSASVFDNVTWYGGSSWTSRAEMQNNTANSLTLIFGQFGDDQVVTIPNYLDQDAPDVSKKIKIVGPEGFSYNSFPTAVGYYDNAGGYVSVSNAFKFTVDQFGKSNPGAYTCTIPAGCMQVDGADVEETEIVFYVEDKRTFTPVDIDFTPNPNPTFSLTTIPGISLRYVNVWPSGARRFVPDTPSRTIMAYFEMEDGTKINCSATNVSSVSGTGTVDFIPEYTLTAGGEYRLVIPEGVIRLKEQNENTGAVTLVCNKALEYTYTVSGGQDYEAVDVKPIISPAPGDVARLARIQFEAPSDDCDMYLADNIVAISVKHPDGSITHANPYTNDNVDGLFAFLDLGTTCMEAGNYVFTVPRGCFEYYQSGVFTINKEFSFSYNVLNVAERDFKYTVDPEDGAKVYKLFNVTLTFEDTDLQYSTGSRATLTYPSGKTAQCVMSFGKQNSRLLVETGYPDEYGVYKLTIPANTLMDQDYTVNNEINLTYTLEERLPKDIKFTTSPEEGIVSELSLITIKAPSDVVALDRYDGGTTMVVFRDDQANETKYYLKATNNPTQYRIELDEEISEEGEYALIIPENTFRVTMEDGTQWINTQQVITWSVSTSGVANIASENGLYDVYGLDGKVVLKGATREQLNGLRGAYVINGRNYLLR